jgi:hypothetical protein
MDGAVLTHHQALSSAARSEKLSASSIEHHLPSASTLGACHVVGSSDHSPRVAECSAAAKIEGNKQIEKASVAHDERRFTRLQSAGKPGLGGFGRSGVARVASE